MSKLENYNEASENHDKAMKEAESVFLKKREELWDSLGKENQLEIFCHVIEKLTKAELHDKRSYRGILYTEFGFGPEAYGAAQLSGFLSLHNSIYPEGLQTLETIQKGLKLYGIEATEEEIQKKLDDEYGVIRKTISFKFDKK